MCEGVSKELLVVSAETSCSCFPAFFLVWLLLEMKVFLVNQRPDHASATMCRCVFAFRVLVFGVVKPRAGLDCRACRT